MKTLIDDLPDWHLKAACRGVDPSIFFPVKHVHGLEAKAICAECPVQEECLEWAVETVEPHGIWGGVSERGRRKIRQQRAREVPEDAKRCAKCGTTKPYDEFPKNRSTKDGHHSYCKPCRSTWGLNDRNTTGWRGPASRLPKEIA